VERLANWLADPAHAHDLAARIAEGLVAAADLLRDEDVHGLLDTLVREQLNKVPLAPLAGRTLAQLTREGRHHALIDVSVKALSKYLGEHGAELHERLGVYSPWWLPGPIQDRLVERLIHRSQQVLDAMAADPDHPLRQQLEAGLQKLAEDLQTSEELRRRGEELKKELLGQPQIRNFAATVWKDTKDQLRAQSAQPGSELRSRLAALIVQTGERLRDDPELAAAAERSLDALVRTVLQRFDKELVALVRDTITRWDGRETSRRLELLLGPDLQYIRINGTIVGGLAGLCLHAISVGVG
jgi:uncharacterized membrane-anchored protein YjiN (DUF445 family)